MAIYQHTSMFTPHSTSESVAAILMSFNAGDASKLLISVNVRGKGLIACGLRGKYR